MRFWRDRSPDRSVRWSLPAGGRVFRARRNLARLRPGEALPARPESHSRSGPAEVGHPPPGPGRRTEPSNLRSAFSCKPSLEAGEPDVAVRLRHAEYDLIAGDRKTDPCDLLILHQ